ncbi:hypothetical protein H8790_03085 [Oscillibacter hominis]|uniref:Uncharacterized protein n=1 Tax=Oscillibacter hominis TaxID=2763056 RepID=A0A7G9B656_9FIRM|nr:hypothetical protein [Oscillibacter hominis]QNL45037.1 hypothetical protein H8790_03085 [Oscillibacter hominis]
MKQMKRILILAALLILPLITTAMAEELQVTMSAGESYRFTNQASDNQLIRVDRIENAESCGYFTTHYSEDGTSDYCAYLSPESRNTFSLKAGESAVITAVTALNVLYQSKDMTLVTNVTPAVKTMEVPVGSRIVANAPAGSRYTLRWTAKTEYSYFNYNDSFSIANYAIAQNSNHSFDGGTTLEVSPQAEAITCYWPYHLDLQCSVCKGDPICLTEVTPEQTLHMELGAGADQKNYTLFPYENLSYEYVSYDTVKNSYYANASSLGRNTFNSACTIDVSPNKEVMHFLAPQAWLDSGLLVQRVSAGKPLTRHEVTMGQTLRVSLPADAAIKSLKIQTVGTPRYSMLTYETGTMNSVGLSDSNWGGETLFPGKTLELTPVSGTVVFFYPACYSNLYGLTGGLYDGLPLTYVNVPNGFTLRMAVPESCSSAATIRTVGTPRYSCADYLTDTIGRTSYTESTWGNSFIKAGHTGEYSPAADSDVTFYYPTFYDSYGVTAETYEGRPMTSYTVNVGDSLRLSLSADSVNKYVAIQRTDATRGFPVDEISYNTSSFSVKEYNIGRTNDAFNVYAGQTVELTPTASPATFFYPTVLEKTGLSAALLHEYQVLYREPFDKGDTLRLSRPASSSTERLFIQNPYKNLWAVATYTGDSSYCSLSFLNLSNNIPLYANQSADVTCNSENGILCFPTFWLERGVLQVDKLNHPAFYAKTVDTIDGTPQSATFAIDSASKLTEGKLLLDNSVKATADYTNTVISTGKSTTGTYNYNATPVLKQDNRLRLSPQSGTMTVYIPYRQVSQGDVLVNGVKVGGKETVTAVANQELYRIEPGDFVVTVTSRSGGYAVAEAAVTVGGVTKPTDTYGRAVFQGVGNGSQLISVTHKNYYNFEAVRTVSSTCRFTGVTLEYAANSEPPYVMSATLTTNHLAYDIRNTDLTLYKLTTAEQESGAPAAVIDLDARVNWGSHGTGKVYLCQKNNNGVQRVSDTGLFSSLQVAEIFKVGRNNLYLYGVAADGTKTPEFKINLSISKLTESKTETGVMSWLKSLNLSVPVSFIAGDNIPFLSQSKLDIGLGKIASAVFSDSGSICIAYGADSVKFQSAAASQNKTALDYFKTYKTEINDLKTAIASKNQTDISNKLAALDAKTGYKPVTASTATNTADWKKPTLNLKGYAQIDKINGEWQLTELSILVTGTSKILNMDVLNKQFVIGYVPIYVEISLKGSVSATGGVKYINYEVTVPLSVSGKTGVSAGAGVGICKVAQVGVTGSGDLSAKMDFSNSSIGTSVDGKVKIDMDTLVSLNGSLGLEAKILGQTIGSTTFAKGTYVLYPTSTKSGAAYALMPADGSDPAALTLDLGSMDLSTPLGAEDRSYLNYSSRWLGGQPQISTFASFTQRAERQILTNVPLETEPLLTDIGGQQVLLWLMDNPERNDRDRTTLVWSVYDKDLDSWSSPAILWDNGTADFYPVVQGDWVVWQKLSRSMTEETVSINDMALCSEIVAAHWNGAGFDVPVLLTDDQVLDYQPAVASSNGKTAVVWTKNSENNILGVSGTSSIVARVLGDDGTWGEPVVLTDGRGAITGLSASYSGTNLLVAFSESPDQQLDSLSDQNVVLLTLDDTGTVTTDLVAEQASHPQLVELNGQCALFFSQDGAIRYLTDLSGSRDLSTALEEGTVPSGEYAVSVNHSGGAVVLWSTAGESSVEVFGAYYDGSSWSRDIQFSSGAYRAAKPTGLFSDDGTLDLAYVRSEELVGTDEEGVQTVTYLSNLCTLQIVPSCDLAVTGFHYDSSKVCSGANLEAGFTVTNCGELAVDAVQAHLYTLDHSIDKTVTLSALDVGASGDFAIPFTVPGSLTYQDFTLEVTPIVSGQPDLDLTPDNNTASATIGGCDLVVSDVQTASIQAADSSVESHRLWAMVSNTGLADCAGATVELRESSPEGKVLATQTLGALAPGEQAMVSYELQIDRGEDVRAFQQFYIVVRCEQEQFAGNNTALYRMERTESTILSQVDTVTPDPADSRRLTVNGTLTNDTANTVSGSVYCAAYSADGALLGLSAADQYQLNNYESAACSFTLTLTANWDEGCTVKLIYLDAETLSPISAIVEPD